MSESALAAMAGNPIRLCESSHLSAELLSISESSRGPTTNQCGKEANVGWCSALSLSRGPRMR